MPRFYRCARPADPTHPAKIAVRYFALHKALGFPEAPFSDHAPDSWQGSAAPHGRKVNQNKNATQVAAICLVLIVPDDISGLDPGQSNDSLIQHKMSLKAESS
jgi:hypothetical protein